MYYDCVTLTIHWRINSNGGFEMRKMFLILLAAMLITSAAAAAPGMTGLRGLFWTTDARTSGPGMMSIGLLTHLGLSSDERTATLPEGVTEVTDTEYDGTGFLTLGFGLGRRAEMSARVSYLVNELKRSDDHASLLSGDWEGDDGFSEAALFFKYNFNPSAERFWISLMPFAGFAIHDGGYSAYVENGDGWDGIWDAGDPMFTMRRPMINSGSFNYGADLLLSWKLAPVVLHGNVGYHMFTQSFEFDDNGEAVDIEVDDPVIRTAGGIELPLGSTTTLFGEVEWRHFTDRNWKDLDDQDFDDCIQVGPGLRFGGPTGFNLDLRGTFALTEFDPEWTTLGYGAADPTETYRADRAPFAEGYAPEWGVGLDLSYTADLSAHPAAVSGRVYDAATGEALPGTVVCSDNEVEPVNTADGTYAMEIPAGTVTLTASSDGYLSAEETVELSRNGVYAVDFGLQPIAVNGTVTGTVTDEATGEPLVATVTCGSARATTDASGNYSISLPVGSRTLTAAASGYASSSATVTVPGDASVTQDFELSGTYEFETVYFDFNQSNIRPDAAAILDAAASYLSGNSVQVRITGHTDSVGESAYNESLGQSRADAVRDFLVAKGISASRLSTASAGEDSPAAANDTEANRALNRRAGFTVL